MHEYAAIIIVARIVMLASNSRAAAMGQELRLCPLVDLSFMGLTCVEEAELMEPRTDCTGSPPRTGRSGRYLSPALRLANNCLRDASGVRQLADTLLETPQLLTWLDLSFNRLESVPVDELMGLSSLRTLYLHANRLDGLEQVAGLRSCDGLRSLTLQGNPLCATPDYRQGVLQAIPQITSLDFCRVLPSERTPQWSSV
ncbi:leucine-rich repeat-containing protein 51-like [Bacillus rossius redtenbacheri]|uniref:leucine-rich repeat-containing protein 51-like n=1 Tax=Bacillus rossius redtenbacheri TaxID=93214 RepID=UPI002FDEC7D0